MYKRQAPLRIQKLHTQQQHTAHSTQQTADSRQQTTQLTTTMMHSSTPVIACDPDGLEGRPALLWLVTITQQSTNQSKVGVKCNLCDKSFAGLTEWMAAHFAKKPGYHVSKCTKATPQATALGKKILQTNNARHGTPGEGYLLHTEPPR